MITVRSENEGDFRAIWEINRLAFGGRDAEAGLVDAIRRSASFIDGLSLVAEVEGQVVGHILFSRIPIETSRGDIDTIALAPMAVLPEFQNRGVGTALVQHGLDACRQKGERSVIVLGHADYYPRFGFRPARPMGIEAPFDVPDEVWMALELAPGALAGVSGKVRYPPAFEGV